MIRSLVGLRGFAACWVVLYHARYMIEGVLPTWKGLQAIAYDGYLGVDIFAVLSGFVICLSYSERLKTISPTAAKQFIWFRLARIYPLIIFSLSLLVVVRLGGLGWENWREMALDRSLWLQVLMLNGWGFESVLSWNEPSWTVSSEWLCYLLFPLAAPLIHKVETGWVAALFAILTLGATAAVMAAVGLPHFSAYLDWGLVRIAGEFLTGCWLCKAFQARFGHGLPWGGIGLLALAVGVFLGSRNAPITVFAFATMVYAFAHEPIHVARAFGNPVSRYLGEISYSIYLMHWIVLVDFAWFLRPYMDSLGGVGLLLIVLLTVIPLSSLTYHLIERPSRAKMRSWMEPASNEHDDAASES